MSALFSVWASASESVSMLLLPSPLQWVLPLARQSVLELD